LAQYAVQQGDCMESIAVQFGFQWEDLWNHPDNSDLRQLRQDPNVLLPGDIVTIPDLTPRVENCITDQLHKFVLQVPSSKLVILLKDFDKPRAGEQYVLTVGGQMVSGTTDSTGKLEEVISPRAQNGRLLVGPPGAQEEFVLKLGHVDPIETPSGVAARLRNLGHPTLGEFQRKYGLPVTDKPDDATIAKLRDRYGC
jgi:hypothetical protein